MLEHAGEQELITTLRLILTNVLRYYTVQIKEVFSERSILRDLSWIHTVALLFPLNPVQWYIN